MKKILLVRHGKSAWNNPNLADHDRPLAERGLKNVPQMAKRLKEKTIQPDLILTSTALRATQTAHLLADTLGVQKSLLHLDKNLYHASANTLQRTIQSQHDSIETIFLVGHNPGMNDFIGYFGGNLDNLPTSGMYGLTLNSDHWRELEPDKVDFWFVAFPKK